MVLVIMAAGMGSRFGGLKQIEPVGPYKEFIIDYSIYDGIKAGFKEVIFIIKKENYEIFRETVGKRIEDKIKVTYVFQNIEDIPVKLNIKREKPWGTGQAILAIKNIVKDNFAVINADDFYDRDTYIKLSGFLKNVDCNSTHFAMVGFKAYNTLGEYGSVKRGICQMNENYLTSLIESVVEYKGNNIIAVPLNGGSPLKVNKDSIVSMNAFAFTKEFFPYLEESWNNFFKEAKDIEKEEFLLPIIVEKMIRSNKCTVEVLKTNSKWYGITYKEDKEKVKEAINEMIAKGQYPKNLWKK